MYGSQNQPGAPRETAPIEDGPSGERLANTQLRILEKIAFGRSLRELLWEVAACLEDLVPEWSTVTHLVDETHRRLAGGVAPSLTAVVAREVEQLVSEDSRPTTNILHQRVALKLRRDDDALPETLREQLVESGFRAVRIVPALSPAGKVLATITVFDRGGSDSPSGKEELLRAATSLLARGVERLRTLERLRLAQSSIDESEEPAVCLRADGSFLYVNDATCGATGYSREELLGMRIFELDPKATMTRYRRIWRVLARRGHFGLDTDIERKDGSFLPVRASTSFVQVENESFACSLVRDVTDVRQIAAKLHDCEERLEVAEERLRKDGLHDDLTGLPSRSTFLDHLKRALERSKRSRTEFRFAVLFLDFDRFKRINDSLGHMAGDRLLLALARRLGTCVRPGDTVARIGGDEFAILLERVGEVTEAIRVAERIHQALREPFSVDGIEVFVTTSIGIAMGSSAYDRPEDVIHDADTAMYRAKAAGRARHEVFDQAMHARAMEQLRLEAELRRGLSHEEFCLLYQPIVDLRRRAPSGFEAFARWNHPARGLLAPSAFLQAAEDSGLIVEIGWWVFGEACRQMQLWRERFDAPELRVHVNLSDRQLFQEDLPGRIEQMLVETGLSPDGLVLDVPENVVMQRADSSVAILAQLKSLGLSIHLDDFGTGYSSLGYLHRFQIDALKIDRSFIRHLRAGGDNWIAVHTIVNLAEGLGMDVIAEGVETDEQLDQLLELGCAYGQGSLFFDPLPSDEVTAVLG